MMPTTTPIAMMIASKLAENQKLKKVRKDRKSNHSKITLWEKVIYVHYAYMHTLIKHYYVPVR